MRPGKSHEAGLFRSLLSDQRPPRSMAGQLGLAARGGEDRDRNIEA